MDTPTSQTTPSTTRPYIFRLVDAGTGEDLGLALPEQIQASYRDTEDPTGIILVALDGTPVTPGTWESQQPGVRRVYVEPS
jgi:hypothetical protein